MATNLLFVNTIWPLTVKVFSIFNKWLSRVLKKKKKKKKDEPVVFGKDSGDPIFDSNYRFLLFLRMAKNFKLQISVTISRREDITSV